MLKLPMLKLMDYDLMYKILESGDVIITFKEFSDSPRKAQ